ALSWPTNGEEGNLESSGVSGFFRVSVIVGGGSSGPVIPHTGPQPAVASFPKIPGRTHPCHSPVECESMSHAAKDGVRDVVGARGALEQHLAHIAPVVGECGSTGANRSGQLLQHVDETSLERPVTKAALPV